MSKAIKFIAVGIEIHPRLKPVYLKESVVGFSARPDEAEISFYFAFAWHFKSFFFFRKVLGFFRDDDQ